MSTNVNDIPIESAEKQHSDDVEHLETAQVDKLGDQVIDCVSEKKLVRKLDLWIVPLMMITYMLQSWDKGLMSSATQFGFNTDLGLTVITGYENGVAITNNTAYSNASMIFYIGYLVGTYPMMFLVQRYSTSRVLGVAIFLWGTVVMSTAGCYNYAGIMINRLVLGILESAVAPTFTVLVTFWWTREEQALRTSMWYSCVGVATTISPLINYALGKIVDGNMESWKFLFIVLGAVTVGWSFMILFFLPDSPLTTRHLTEDQRSLAIRRLERNRAGTINHTFNRGHFIEAFTDYKLWTSALIILLTGVPSGAIGTFGTIVINGFGFDHFQSLALTCPIGAVTFLSILTVGYITRKIKNSRYICIIVCALISISGTLICWFGPRDNRGLLFAGIFLLAVQVASGGLAVSLVASNIAGHTKKSTVSASTFVGYCVGNVIGPVIFGASPGPRYHAGFVGSFICLVLVVIIAAITYFLLRRENAMRDRAAGRSVGLHHHFDEDLSDEKNEDFRYVL